MSKYKTFEENLQAIEKIKATKLTEASSSKERKAIEALEMMVRNINNDYSTGVQRVKDTIETVMTTDAIKLIPKIIEGKMIEAAEPVYLASNFFSKVKVDDSNAMVYVIPVIGDIVAKEVQEGARYDEDYIDVDLIENGGLEIRVRKFGIKVSVTEEALSDTTWDIYGISARKMGQAMARLREEQCFEQFSASKHVIFDNNIRQQLPSAGTTGLGKDGLPNDTLSVEDFLDLVLALMGQGKVPTDAIMHPLVWVVFARNSMIGNGMTYGALNGQNVHPWGFTQGTGGFAGLPSSIGPQKMILTPDQVQNRLPIPLTMNFSPYVKFDKTNKRFDMYVIDRSEVGIIAQKEELSLDNWSDPEKDVRMMKTKERYGIGILNNGRGITVAKNIAVAPSYPETPVVSVRAVE